MLIKILLIVFGMSMNNQKILFDFESNEEVLQWRKVNDTVMGGVSKSSFKLNDDGSASFEGLLSPDNNGGFASFRTLLNDNLVGYEGVHLRVKGDGNIYSIRFRTNNSFDGYSYQAKFETKKDKMVEVQIQLSKFLPIFRGRMLRNKPMLESKDIKQLGILISDKQFGNFTLDIDWIKLY